MTTWPTLETTRDRVLLGKCTTYSAQTGNFCEVEGKHVIHKFTSPNGHTQEQVAWARGRQ